MLSSIHATRVVGKVVSTGVRCTPPNKIQPLTIIFCRAMSRSTNRVYRRKVNTEPVPNSYIEPIKKLSSRITYELRRPYDRSNIGQFLFLRFVFFAVLYETHRRMDQRPWWKKLLGVL